MALTPEHNKLAAYLATIFTALLGLAFVLGPKGILGWSFGLFFWGCAYTIFALYRESERNRKESL